VVEKLGKRVRQLERFQPGKRLLTITGISSQFFDLQQATEDKTFLVQQLEKLQYTVKFNNNLIQ